LETHECASTAIFNENTDKMGKVLIETLKNLLTRIPIRATFQPDYEV